MFTREEFKLFRRCEDFLWSVRCNMHFVAGRAEERLSFDIQREIAVRLGYTEHPGMQDVERFMKHYFLTAKDVGDLTAILCAGLEERQAKPAPVLSRFIARLRPAQEPTHAERESDDFVVDNNRINIARARRIRARSGQPDPAVPPRAKAQSRASIPRPCAIATRSLKLIDKRRARRSRRPTACSWKS